MSLRRIHALAGCVVLFAAAIASAADPALPILEERAFQQAAAIADPAVCRIETVGGFDVVGDLLAAEGPTTGVVVDPDGWIITSSFNFIAQPSSILVTTAAGERYPARIVGRDESRRLTLLKIDATDLKTLTPVPRDEIRVGQWAIALGRTYDPTFPNLSVGIISALSRISGKALQTDAKVSPVNYGGPLVDVDGRCYGILVPMSAQDENVTAGVELYDSGLGFAVPLTDILSVLDRLKAGQTLKPGKLGIQFTEQKLVDGPIKIEGVQPRSPAEKAGLKGGDQIVAVDGREVVRAWTLRQILGPRYGGDRVTLKVRRGEQTLEIPVELTEEIPPVELASAGILFERVGKAPADSPAKIRHIFPKSPAEMAGLKTGEVITKVNDTETATLAACLVALRRVGPEDKVSLELAEGDAKRTVELTVQAWPAAVPAEVPPQHIPSPDETAKLPEKVGRFVDQIAGDDRRIWVYVPDNFNPAASYGVLVWLHPAGDKREGLILERFKSICDERGLILIGPPSTDEGWGPGDIPFLLGVISQFGTTYNADFSRIVLLGEGAGARLAHFLGLQHSEMFAAVATFGTPLPTKTAAKDSGRRALFYIAAFEGDPQFKAVQRSLEVFKERKQPVISRTFPGTSGDAPTAELAEELGRWIDTLDGF